MHSILDLRKISRILGGFIVLLASAIGMRGQSLPAMPPTNQPGQAAAVAAPVVVAPLHAEVAYTNGLLQIRADNSSLNQILRSISHVTGLKITGGVEEQRVFGNYGPAPLSTILATLLSGTGSNVLLIGGNSGSTPELVLTSRTGGAEPPGPNSSVYAMYDDGNDRARPVPPPVTHGPASPPSVQTTESNAPTAAVPPPPPVSVRAPGQPLTPEMVEQELLLMQAQQDQKKKDLDEKMRQQQVDQNRKLKGAGAQSAPSPPPVVTPTPQ